MPDPRTRTTASAPRRLGVVGAFLVWLWLGGWAAAQTAGLAPSDPPLPEVARPAFESAVAALREADESPHPWSPDAPAWRVALGLTRAAVEAAPDHPAPRRLLFRTYTAVGWWVRAVDAADDWGAVLADLGVSLRDAWDDGPEPVPGGAPTRDLVTQSFAELGFARYQAGALPAALDVYERWLAWEPDEPEALRWIGRLWLELGDPAAALPYWQRLLALTPDDDAARFFVAEARLGVEVGSEAGVAFRQGVTLYEAGDLDGALLAFDAARAAAPTFVDAHAWAGRAALDAERPADAVERYGAALALRPDDAGLVYFVRLAQTQVDVGVVAGRAFFEAQEAYQAGDLPAAAAALERAVAARGDFGEAWAWLGRVRQEQARYGDAETAWARVLALDPRDERARGFLNLAREQRAYFAAGGRAAGAATDFAAGVAAFEGADFAAAADRFRRVVEADPASGLGWTWLGRVTYTVRDFAAAAEAFGRARALLPDDDDVAWFADDAAARAAESGQP